jgi:hypothetical protein
MSIKSGGLGVLVGIALAGGGAFAAQEISSIIGPDGTISACYSLKNGSLRVVDPGTACARGESTIQWNQQGPTGPQGVTGPPGPPGPAGTVSSLNGVPCDTGSLDKPDGRITVSAVTADGTMTLKCLSASTNPALALELDGGPGQCQTVLNITTCFIPYYTARELDGSGAPVANGFTCVGSPLFYPPGLPPAFIPPQTCTTQRFTAGSTVRLGVDTITGLAPSWTGCTSVSVAGVCTLSLTASATVKVVPVTSP